MKNLKVLSTLFIFSLVVVVSFAQIKEANFPSPVGFVNDFANVLFPETKSGLENRLRDYRNQTSIEVTVVTVNNLNGLSVEEYANVLFRKWGVGDKKKNNGIVFLIAPNEHQMRIEVGYGLEPDLTDAQASEILRNSVKPLFKNKQIDLGILTGVNAIIKTLGQTPFEARAGERRLAKEKRKREEEIANRKIKSILIMVGLIILISFFVIAAYLFLEKRRAEIDRFKLIHMNNADRIKICQVLAEKIEKSLPVAEKRLETLKGKIPEKQFESLNELLAAAKKNLPLQKNDLETLTNSHLKTGWKNADVTSKKVEELLEELKIERRFPEAVDNKVVEVREAETKSQNLLAEIPKLIKSLENELNHTDVSSEAKNNLEKAKTDFEKAKNLTRDIKTSWLTIFASLSAVATLISAAREKGSSDKAEAEQARKEGPDLLAQLPKLIAEAEKTVNHSDVSGNTKKLLKDAKKQFENIEPSASQSPINWLAIFPTLLLVAQLIERASKKAGQDIEEAEESRKPKFVATTTEQDSDSNSSFGLAWSSDSSSSSDSGSSGDFGGFSGGDSGGGGASDSW